jgi:maleate isomerase
VNGAADPPARDYGRQARIGLVTPQANPTAEPEFGLLMPGGVTMLTARCTSQGEAEQRFRDYFEQLDHTLAAFDTLQLDAIGFACTASSYLIDPGAEKERVRVLAAERGCPVITAAFAIEKALRFLGAKTIALACPYPAWLFERAVRYWRERGFAIAHALSLSPDMGDTRAIYEVSGEQAAADLCEQMAAVEADAFVITGTGMPGLRPVVELQLATERPAMNSNLCLAWACLEAAGAPPGDRAPEPAYPLLGGWAQGLARL